MFSGQIVILGMAFMNGLGTISSRSSKEAQTKDLSLADTLGKIDKDAILGEDDLLAEILDVSLEEISNVSNKVPDEKKTKRGRKRKNKD